MCIFKTSKHYGHERAWDEPPRHVSHYSAHPDGINTQVARLPDSSFRSSKESHHHHRERSSSRQQHHHEQDRSSRYSVEEYHPRRPRDRSPMYSVDEHRPRRPRDRSPRYAVEDHHPPRHRDRSPRHSVDNHREGGRRVSVSRQEAVLNRRIEPGGVEIDSLPTNYVHGQAVNRRIEPGGVEVEKKMF